jgi:hypothetical protein
MKYIILTYAHGGQIMLEAIGPETITGMVSDVMRGNYDKGDEAGGGVIKIEIGNEIDKEKWKVKAA